MAATTTLANNTVSSEASNGGCERNREPLPNGTMVRELRREREAAPLESPRDSPATNRIRTFMGKTPSAIKSKFLSVLGNSTEIINGISNKVSMVVHGRGGHRGTEDTSWEGHSWIDAPCGE